LSSLVALIALLLSAPLSASAHHRPGHAGWCPPVTEDTNPEGVPGDLPEKGDDKHLSGEARSDEKRECDGEDVDDETLDQAAEGPEPVKEDKNKLKVPQEEEGADQHGGKGCEGDDVADDNEGDCRRPKVHRKAKVRGEQPPPAGTVSDTQGTTAGTAGAILAPGNVVTTARGAEGARLSSVRSIEDPEAQGSGAPRLLFKGGGTTLGGAQPSLAIVVNALNDADGDGIYSDSEIAPVPGADISFKAVISNNGVTPFEIVSVNHTFTEPSGRAQIEVCGDLGGLKVASGESLACLFSVSDYSPPLGESVVSSVSASAIEVGGSGRRGTSDSDNSTVATLLGDEVLASVVQRVPGPLAFTGTDTAWLVALALVFLAAGGGLSVLARVRGRRPEDPVLRTGPWIRLPGLRSSAPTESRPPQVTAGT
jgi:hypothetical protein